MFKQFSSREAWAIGLSTLASFLSCPFAGANPAAANQQSANALESVSDSCQNAIAASVEQLKTGRQLNRIQTQPVDLTKTYDDYPQGQPLGVSFIIEGQEANQAMGAAELQHQISRQVINSCNRVSFVEFGVYRTDWSSSYGLFADGQIKPFDCRGLGPGPALVWGLDFC
ncbi:MAG: hypothetical protein ABEI32_04030 [Halothece sp.]